MQICFFSSGSSGSRLIPIGSGLTLSSLGFSGSLQPRGGGGGGHKVLPHRNFFVIDRIMMKLGKLVKCYKLYLLVGFWCVNWLRRHNEVIVYGVSA